MRLGGAPRRGWPAGLRALFLASGAGLVIEVAQLRVRRIYGAGRRGARRIWFGWNHGSPGVVVVSSASIQ